MIFTFDLMIINTDHVSVNSPAAILEIFLLLGCSFPQSSS